MGRKLLSRLIAIIVGCVFLVMGCIVLSSENKSAKENTESATAVVIAYDIERQEDDDGGYDTYYYPVLEFTAGGEKITAKYSVGYGKREYAEGTKLEIKYNPENPSNYSIVGDNSGRILGIIALVAGAALILLPLIGKLVKIILYRVGNIAFL